MIVSFADEPTPVWQIPFPAVTICPTTKINTTMFNILDGFTEVIKHNRRPVNFSDEEYEIDEIFFLTKYNILICRFTVLNAVNQLCDPEIGVFFANLGLRDYIADRSIVNLLKKVRSLGCDCW